PDRQELIRNAVVFLNDPNARPPLSIASPLTQRIQFLEAKGLTPSEIDLAIRQAAQTSSYGSAFTQPPYPQMPPAAYRWDWRDYFITAVVSGTVAYSAVAIFKKYLLPHLRPPTSTAYEADRDALTAQFDAAEALLKEIQAESTAMRVAVEAQRERIDETTKNVDAMVQEVRDGEAKTRDEMREIREEINSIREMLPKMIERNKDSQTQSLNELQQELKSLKALLLSRGPTISSSSVPSSPLPALGRPSIPAWQLAGTSSTESTPSTPPDLRPASPSKSRPQGGPTSPPSTGQLAESALSNLRKSLAHQRPASPGKSPPPRAKSTLEDRLRASFTIGEVSNDSTPAASLRVSPDPPPMAEQQNAPNSVSEIAAKPALELVPARQPMSPSSTPLPESRVSSPIQLHDPLSALHMDPPLVSAVSASPKPQFLQVNQVSALATDIHVDPPLAPVVVPASPKPQSPQINQVSALEAEVSLPPDESSRATDVDALQARLKLVEQRFSDVSTSFKRLQAEKAAADAILRESTPLETISDLQALRDYVQNVVLKAEISSGEITRLNAKLETQETRIEELRDTHRLESSSQSTQIEQLRRQLAEAETLLKASQGSVAQGDENATVQKAEIDRLLKEVEQANRAAKEEEEKRVKAISLLKTVRQKLVKAEKERDDTQRDLAASRDKEKAERDKEQHEKSRLQAEIEITNAERDKTVTGLKTQFDREIASFKDRHEKETAMLRGQFELEALTTKSSHTKEVTTLTSRISSLDITIAALTNDKNAFFDQLQLRQAELESAQSHLDSLQSQNTELQYQLRESEDRLALLNEDMTDARQEQDSRSREPSNTAEDVAHLLAATQEKYESKLADLRRNQSVLEKERTESEAQWSRKLREKVRENEELKLVLGSATKSRELDEGVVGKLKDEIKVLQEQVRLHRAELAELRAQSVSLEDLESSNKAQETETSAKIGALEQLLDEAKSREAQLRASNKTLREELRKVQSSAALLRNPGVGYWTSRAAESSAPEIRTSLSSASSADSRSASPALPQTSSNNEEEVNLEYLRNVILQFLEHKEMRPNLVKVLSIILHFTPQETRRLIAKV
ncbi:hypothetical protein GGX14DRAFT_638792, partial [Mycena pura]